RTVMEPHIAKVGLQAGEDTIALPVVAGYSAAGKAVRIGMHIPDRVDYRNAVDSEIAGRVKYRSCDCVRMPDGAAKIDTYISPVKIVVRDRLAALTDSGHRRH